ncbi:MAG TPA: polysaccharide pyruvyl transferase family protein [Modestobacter sp.]|nr:polysaccharide pyruvyl transferase family protein [Modestobacter sp.]
MFYLISTAGHPNVGDELITRTWLRELAQRAPEAEVWLDCPHPSGAQALFAGEHPRLRCVDTLFRLCAEAPADTPWDVAAFVSSALDDHGLAPRWVPGLRVFSRASTVHLLGGGYVNSMWPRQIGLLAALHWAAGRGASTAATGQGFSPLSSEHISLVRRLLERVDRVDVRDDVSAEAIGRPASRSGDDLWLAELDSLVDADRAPELDALVCVQGDLLEVSEERLTAQCMDHLRLWDVDPARTAVVECIPRVDRPIFDRLRHLLPGLQFIPWVDVLERGLPAGRHQRWFSSRFHPHMIAARAGARGVAVPVRAGYYDVKHGSLLDAGSDWRLLSAEAPVVDGLTRQPTGRLAASGQRIREVKLAFADGLYGAVAPRTLLVAPEPAGRTVA